MTAPDRIWIDAWGGNWSPRAGGTQEIEYIRADLIPAALAVPEVRALVDSATALVQAMCDDTDIMAKWHIVEKMNEVAAGFRALRGEGRE